MHRITALPLGPYNVCPCSILGHTLRLAIKDFKETTPGVSDILKKCLEIVGHYKHSTQATTRLQDWKQQWRVGTVSTLCCRISSS